MVQFRAISIPFNLGFWWNHCVSYWDSQKIQLLETLEQWGQSIFIILYRVTTAILDLWDSIEVEVKTETVLLIRLTLFRWIAAIWVPLTGIVLETKNNSELTYTDTLDPIRFAIVLICSRLFLQVLGTRTHGSVSWDMSRNSVPEAWNKACAEASTCHLEADQAENLLNLLQIVAPLKPVEENAGGVRPLMDHPDGFMVASCHWKDVGNALSNCANQVSSAPRAKIPKSICCTSRSWPDRVLCLQNMFAGFGLLKAGTGSGLVSVFSEICQPCLVVKLATMGQEKCMINCTFKFQRSLRSLKPYGEFGNVMCSRRLSSWISYAHPSK